MIHSDILAAAPTAIAIAIDVEDGFGDTLDRLAERAPAGHAFLRAAWFGGRDDGGVTIVARRADGTPLAAVPFLPLAHALLGAGTVPGSYWPFRAVPIASDATAEELQAVFCHPRLGFALLPMLRVGPSHGDDRTGRALVRAARRAGWTVLERGLGHSFTLDLAAEARWPRKTTRRRLEGYERQLGRIGAVRYRHVTGDAWRAGIFDTLAAIEARSWVGTRTDGSGAKFINPRERTHWERVAADPVLRHMLSATILRVGDTPAAFSLDLAVGDTQYGIASSYDEAFAAGRPGKLVTWRQFAWARERGVRTVDLGTGDSGYKREMGAVPGSPVVDRLFVRSRSAAKLLAMRWGSGDSPLLPEPSLGTPDGTQLRPRRLLNHIVVAGGIAAAALALAE